MKFRTMYNNELPIPAIPAGERYRMKTKVLQPFEVDAKGNCINRSRFPKTIETGERFDQQAFIDSHLDSTRIQTILRQLGANRENYVLDDNIPVTDLTALQGSIYDLKSAKELYQNKILPALDNIQKQQLQQQQQQQSLSNDDIVALKALLAKKEVVKDE